MLISAVCNTGTAQPLTSTAGYSAPSATPLLPHVTEELVCSTRAQAEHHSHFPSHFQPSQVSPNLSPRPFQAPFPSNTPPRHSGIYSRPGQPHPSTLHMELGSEEKKNEANHRSFSSSRSARHHHQPMPGCARFRAGHAGLKHPWHGDLPGWVLSGATVLLLAGFVSSVD